MVNISVYGQGYNLLNKDSFRTGTSDTPLCDCGKADEPVEHFLLHCEKYTEARKVMLDTIEDLVVTSKCDTV